jgi:hypothetical protein
VGCESCGDSTHVVAWSDAAKAHVCFRCYGKLPEAQYVPPIVPPVRLPPPPPSPPPTPYMRLHARVYGALKRVGLEVTGEEFSVFGIGDPDLPLMGWCPACRQGTVAVRLIDADPPALDVEGCTAGCTDVQVSKAFQ